MKGAGYQHAMFAALALPVCRAYACGRGRRRTQATRRPVPKGSPAMTSVSSISPRLISAVSPEPASLLAATAAELAAWWNSGNYDLGSDDAATDIACISDALRSLASLFDPESDEPYRNLYDWACDLADGQLVSVATRGTAGEAQRPPAARRKRAASEPADAHSSFAAGSGLPGLRDLARAAAGHAPRSPRRRRRLPLYGQRAAGPDRPDACPVAGPAGLRCA